MPLSSSMKLGILFQKLLNWFPGGSFFKNSKFSIPLVPYGFLPLPASSFHFDQKYFLFSGIFSPSVKILKGSEGNPQQWMV